MLCATVCYQRVITMLIHYVMILLSSLHVSVMLKTTRKRNFMLHLNEVITSEEASLLRDYPTINFDRIIRPVRGFPGVKLKVVKTGQRLSFEKLFDKVLLDSRNWLVGLGRPFRSKFSNLHLQLVNSSDYFKATKGRVEDFTTMWRYGRLELAKFIPNLTMDVFVTFYSLRIHYKRFILCVDNRTSRGHVTGFFQRNLVQVRVNFTLRPCCVYHLCSVRLNEFGHTRYDFQGLEYKYNRSITETVSYSITRHFVDNYRHTFERAIYFLFNKSFSQIDPCAYFNYNPKEW